MVAFEVVAFGVAAFGVAASVIVGTVAFVALAFAFAFAGIAFVVAGIAAFEVAGIVAFAGIRRHCHHRYSLRHQQLQQLLCGKYDSKTSFLRKSLQFS